MMSVNFTKLLVVSMLTVLLSVACIQPHQRGITKGENSLFKRLGGKEPIGAVVDEAIKNIAADKRINDHFANANIPRLRTMLVEQICEATGGPCKYVGGDMKSVHKGMNVTEADFIALVEDLSKAMLDLGVPIREHNELIGLLAPMKKDIEYQ